MAGTDPTCPTCGKDFETLRGMRVHHAKAHDEILPNCTCADCQTEFYDPNSARVYCDDCMPSRERTRDRWTYGNTEGTCIVCGATFLYYPSENPGQYCPDCVDAIQSAARCRARTAEKGPPKPAANIVKPVFLYFSRKLTARTTSSAIVIATRRSSQKRCSMGTCLQRSTKDVGG